jgi:hypothetical protein
MYNHVESVSGWSMTSFVAWYGKKSLQLKKHECELIALLRKGAAVDKLLKGVEVVRMAHIRALKSRIAQLPASEKSADTIQELARKIDAWHVRPSQSILAHYQQNQFRVKRPKPRLKGVYRGYGPG